MIFISVSQEFGKQSPNDLGRSGSLALPLPAIATWSLVVNLGSVELTRLDFIHSVWKGCGEPTH